jgi:hypothetical protein
MPGGEDTIRGLSVTFTAVTRHHSGHYMCSADNGFGQPSVANLKLDVQRELTKSINNTFHTKFYSLVSLSSDINTYFSYREMVSNDKITIVNI